MNAQTYWNKLKKTGWLDGIPSARHAEIKAQLARNLAKCPAEAHAALAQGVIEAGESSPSAILRALSVAASGAFVPTSVSEKKVARNLQLSFRSGQTEFNHEMPDDPVSIMTETVEVANQSLAKSGRSERFFVLDSSDAALIVFVPPSVFQRARAAKLIPGRKTAIEFAIAPESKAKDFAVAEKKSSKSRSKRFFYEHLPLDALRELFASLCSDIAEPLRELLCTSHGAVVLGLHPDAVSRLLAIKKGELNQCFREWLKKPTMQDSPFADEVAFCTDRFADVIGFLARSGKAEPCVLISVRPD